MMYLVCAEERWGRYVYAGLPCTKSWTCITSPDILESVARAIEPRYIFFLHWSHRVPATVFNSFECVNFHCTPLPYGRGGNPIENLILRGKSETVITAHKVIEEIDAGPIYMTSGPIILYGTKQEILARFVEPCITMIKFIVEYEPAPAPQMGQATLFHRLSREDYARFWENR